MASRGPTIGPRLVVRLAEAAVDDVLEVVIELRAPDLGMAAAARSRPDRAALQRDAFDAWSESVAERLRDLGGSLVGHAWINSTLKAAVPARRVAELAAVDKVERLDVAAEL